VAILSTKGMPTMNLCFQNPDRCAALLEQAIQEQQRCERLQDTWASVDSQAADACQFDAGSLYACCRLIETMQRGGDLLDDIAALIGLIAELNAERGEDEPCPAP
jgi:hypothetical protein